MKTIKQLGVEAHENSKAKGFYDKPDQNVGERLMLIVSELSEALEADRNGKYCNFTIDSIMNTEDDGEFFYDYQNAVKGTFEEEMADAGIRLLEYCEYLGIDLQAHMEAKMRYNSLRPHMHGGKKY